MRVVGSSPQERGWARMTVYEALDLVVSYGLLRATNRLIVATLMMSMHQKKEK